MWVESTLGEGSTFYFTLKAPVAPLPPLEPTPLANHSLLIVTAQPVQQLFLKSQAEQWDMQTAVVESGEAAIAWLMSHSRPDMAILDFQLPDCSGLELSPKIHQLPELEQLPIAVMAMLGTQERQVREQGLLLIHKPIKHRTLRNRLLEGIVGQPPADIGASPRHFQFDPELGKTCPLRILLAEDNRVNQQVALNILGRMGYSVDVAKDGLEVLEALQRQVYDLILMDVQMPEMDGLTATRRIRQRQTIQPQIIAMTAGAMERDRTACLKAGMNGYISKPFQLEELVALLRQCPRLELESVPIARAVPEDQRVANHSTQAPPLDLDIIQALRELADEEDPDFLQTMIETFQIEAQNLLQEMRTALSSANLELLCQATHTLRSNSSTIGAVPLTQFCRELENLSQAGAQISDLEHQLRQIVQEFERVCLALQEEA
jgi:CheY-like chemotaxis protein